MKQLVKNVGISLIMGMILPYLFLSFGVTVLNRYREQTPQPAFLLEQTEVLAAVSLPVRLRMEGDAVLEMDMDTYLVGVLLAEMPVSFDLEALKAQACVARTYARKAYTTGGKHGDGSICTDSACCQGYKAPDIYLAEGGTEEEMEKVQSAVRSTSGYVLMYDGELIEATYFSCSGGRTEDAVAVWGREFPYLQAVDSPGEENAAYFTDSKQFTASEFAQLLQLPLIEDPASWLGTTTYTEGGGVHTMVIGGKTFTGTELRSLLGLRSTAFSMTADPTGVSVITRGYGHRVGMSQYGANAMAISGSTWEEIVSHYYQNAELVSLS